VGMLTLTREHATPLRTGALPACPAVSMAAERHAFALLGKPATPN
jgi:hypothetical protein